MFLFIYALANLIINPIAIYFMWWGDNDDVVIFALVWVIVTSMVIPGVRNIVLWLFVSILRLGLFGVGAFGILGFIFIAFVFVGLAVYILIGVLILLWFYSLFILAQIVLSIQGEGEV